MIKKIAEKICDCGGDENGIEKVYVRKSDNPY